MLRRLFKVWIVILNKRSFTGFKEEKSENYRTEELNHLLSSFGISGLFQETPFPWRWICSFCHPLSIFANLDKFWASGKVPGLQMLSENSVSWWIFQIVRFYWMCCNIYGTVLPSYSHSCCFGGTNQSLLFNTFHWGRF